MSAQAIDRLLWACVIIVGLYWTGDLLWRIHVSNRLLDEVWPPATREVRP